jgi:hypothetical protein
MKYYRINYIDGHDLRYKSFETPAKSKEAAVSALCSCYQANFDHRIIEIIEVKEPVSQGMRIGRIPSGKRSSGEASDEQ